MSRERKFISLFLASFVAGFCLLSCRRESAIDVGAPTQADLALSLGGGQPVTKADFTILSEIAESPVFRGMYSVRVLPYAASSSVGPGDVSISEVHYLPAINSDDDLMASSNGEDYHRGLIRNNNAHLYPGADANLPLGTATVLVYGKSWLVESASSSEEKRLNGSLRESGFTGGKITAGDITFSPDPLIPSTSQGPVELPHQAQEIADILNEIAEDAFYPQTYFYQRNGVYHQAVLEVRWDQNLGSPELREAFTRFTNDGQLTTGAGENVKYLLSALYSSVSQYENNDATAYKHKIGSEEFEAVLSDGGTDPLTYGSMYMELKAILMARFEQLRTDGLITISGTDVDFVSQELRTYPSSLGLPAGAAALRWNGFQFVTVSESLDGVAPIDRYCYMPSLYYFTNSTISTSTTRDIYTQYTSSVQTWEQILSQYRSGKVVVNSSRSVAVDTPLEYANGMLVLTVRASSSQLPDNDGDARTSCEVSGTLFPVTGIIVGGQFRQRYDFTPDPSATDEYFIYDNKVSDVYLTASTSNELRTLVLPTPANRDVYFFLELRNDSNSAFYGAEGIILPGSHFYLAGKLDRPEEGSDHIRVFESDYYTTANCTVSTLENAHVSVPEMGDPQLSLGVQTFTGWTQSAASYVVLE